MGIMGTTFFLKSLHRFLVEGDGPLRKRNPAIMWVAYAPRSTMPLRPGVTWPKEPGWTRYARVLSLSRGQRPLSRTRGTGRNLGDLAFGGK